MSKDYSNEKHLTLGHLSHEQVAQTLLNTNRNSENLMSICRAGHDRIHHLLHRVNHSVPVAAETQAISAQLEEVPVNIGGVEIVQPRMFSESEVSEIRCQNIDLNRANESLKVEVATLTGNLANAEQSMSDANANAAAQLEALNAQLAEVQAKLDSANAELTQAYMAKGAAEAEAADLRAKLQDIHDNFEIEGEESDGEDDQPSTEEAGYYVPTRDELREIATAHSFRVRPQPNGKEDLNDYVYDTMYASIKLSHDKTPK